jgi:hypothetical protein
MQLMVAGLLTCERKWRRLFVVLGVVVGKKVESW